jgi:hypothetical protein
MQEPLGENWGRYGRALIKSMREVLAESPEDLHGLLLETADYWLSLGYQSDCAGLSTRSCC